MSPESHPEPRQRPSAAGRTGAKAIAVRWVAGVDEVGRGPLAGPVVAAAVVLHPARPIEGLGDSKRLTPRRREQLAVQIRRQSAAWALAWADPGEIDQLNILGASLLAMSRAVLGLTITPAELRVDGQHAPRVPGFTGPVHCLVGGDRLDPAIGAASIVAKVYRDALMCELDQRHPGYGFAAHKGYPTIAHRAALAALGPSTAHRLSFAPVRAALQVREPVA
ncbi:MAG: ribonuclease HII [Gammaproteobacteria bacterium]|nr:ribonuclease HII [Gammaproteobacteria bacterium]